MSLDWANERYIRVYTRDTDEWLVLPWQSRAVWPLLMRKAERSGFVPARLGARGVAVLIGLPADVVEPGIVGLLEDGCLAKVDGGYFIPNFLEAQETRSSDAQRQRDSRERRRAEKMREVTGGGDLSHSVTSASPPVTTGHIESPSVTPYSAVPDCAELISDSLPRGAPAGARDPLPEQAPPVPRGDDGQVWALVRRMLGAMDLARKAMDPDCKRLLAGQAGTGCNDSERELAARIRSVPLEQREEIAMHVAEVLCAEGTAMGKAGGGVGHIRIGMLNKAQGWDRLFSSTVESAIASRSPRAPPSRAQRDVRVGNAPARANSHATPDGIARIETEF